MFSHLNGFPIIRSILHGEENTVYMFWWSSLLSYTRYMKLRKQCHIGQDYFCFNSFSNKSLASLKYFLKLFWRPGSSPAYLTTALVAVLPPILQGHSLFPLHILSINKFFPKMNFLSCQSITCNMGISGGEREHHTDDWNTPLCYILCW